MKRVYIFSAVMIFSFVSNAVNGQILNRLKNRIQNEVIDKVADKVADKLADEIADRAYRSLDKAFEEQYKTQLKDSLGTDEVTEEQWSSFLSGFGDASEKMQDAYSFDHVVSMKLSDAKGDENRMELYISKEGNYMGMKSFDKGEEAMIVMDFDQDINIIYSNKDGEKTVMAMPSFTGLIASSVDMEDINIEKTGKTKQVLGYTCDEMVITSDDYTTTSYISNALPFNIKDSYSKMISSFAPQMQASLDEVENGFMLYGETIYHDSKEKQIQEVTQIDSNATVIKTSDYKKMQQN